MRGKIVNLCIGLMNLLLGLIILFFTIYIPQDKILITVQEGYVVSYIKLALYAIVIATAVIDFIQSINLKSDSTFYTGYMLGCVVVTFFFIKAPVICIFSILSGLIVLFKTLKENLVEINSTTGISVSLVIMACCGIVALVCYNYQNIGQYIKNKENKNQLAYVDDYFKYITELNIQDPYINVCKEGKFGYMTPNGDMAIPFKYDYASPFIKIKVFDKVFDVALVCENNESRLIMKNERVIMTYRSESAVENYGAKIEELKDIYKNTLKQKGTMEYEIIFDNSNIKYAPAYIETSDDYTFRYDYNDEYDLIVTQSNMGLGDIYELAKKADRNSRIQLSTTYLDYDSSHLFLFSNGCLPFYEVNKKTQGWFTSYGKKEIMTGNAQILDFFGDRILLRNYNNDTVYFINSKYEKISEEYKKIFICNEDRYIVEGEDTYFKVIDKEYKKVFEKEYSVINPRLASNGIYIVLDSTENIKFNDYGYPIMNWKLLNSNGEVIGDDIQYVYDLLYEKPEGKNILENNYIEFVEKLKDIRYEFVGDKFYLNY